MKALVTGATGFVGGRLGAIAHALFVRRDVERIFAYRRLALAKRL